MATMPEMNLVLDAGNLPPQTPSSVEIARNAKGETVYAVKFYSAVGDEEATADRAMALYARLQATYGESKP